MDFKRAIQVAKENALELVPKARDFVLEEVVIDGNNINVTLSYYLDGPSPLDLDSANEAGVGIIQLARLMSTRRESKVFIIDRLNYSFKGFRAYRQE